MDIKNFALQDWVKRDLILLKRISTKNNYSDAMTKSLQRILFYRHMNYISGKYIPDYAKQTRQTQCIKKVCFNLGQHQNKPISKHGRMRCIESCTTPIKDKYPLTRRDQPSAKTDVTGQKATSTTDTKMSELQHQLPLTDTLDTSSDTLDTFL